MMVPFYLHISKNGMLAKIVTVLLENERINKAKNNR